MSDFKKTVTEQVRDLLRDNLGDKFKQYFIGDPLAVPQSMLPCLAIEKEQTDITHGPTGMDEVRTTVVVKIMLNKKDDFGKPDRGVLSQQSLEEFAEGRDESSGEFHSQSIAGLLRKNFTLTNEIENQELSIQYGVTPRPDQVITAEAHVRAVIEELEQVSNRT